jgi:erythromycin esterase
MKKKLLAILLTSMMILSATACGKQQTSEEWYEKNTHEITSLDSEDYSDLQFLKPLLKDKKVVAMGENFHSVGDYMIIKTRLIKYLHEELGYDAIGFESGLGECAMVMNNKQLTPIEMMQYSILGVWHSQETLNLFNYIKEQSETEKPLDLFGYDMQFTSMYFIDYLTEWLEKVDKNVSQEYYQLELSFLQEYYTLLNKFGLDSKGHYEEYQEVINTHKDKYDKIIRFIKDNKDKLQDIYPDNSVLVDSALIMLNNRMNIVNMSMVGIVESYELRDRIMADNVEWYIKSHPDKKIILWAHNDHLAKNTSKMLTLENDEWNNSFVSMGELLHKKFKEDMYVLGFYMQGGKATCLTTGEVYDVPAIEEGSLESIISQSDYKNTFIDLSKNTKVNEFNKWMFTEQYANEDGLSADIIRAKAMKLVPIDQYDGLIVLDEVSAPTKLNN